MVTIRHFIGAGVWTAVSVTTVWGLVLFEPREKRLNPLLIAAFLGMLVGFTHGVVVTKTRANWFLSGVVLASLPISVVCGGFMYVFGGSYPNEGFRGDFNYFQAVGAAFLGLVFGALVGCSIGLLASAGCSCLDRLICGKDTES